MYSLNKFIGYLSNPVTLAWVGILLALCLRIIGRRRLAGGLLILCIAWIWLWATPLMSRMVGASLERPYLVDGRMPAMGSYPKADAIELHGGSMGDDSEFGGRGEMWTSADRVWMAARLWRAQARKVKVEGAIERSEIAEGLREQWRPKLFVTGGGVKKSTAGLLEDFGIPTNAIVFAESPRNTEEEAKFISRLFADANPQSLIPNPSTKPKVLVVTSAWHMKRTMMMYAKYAPNVEAIPAPCDFENTLSSSSSISIYELVPSDETLVRNRVCLHEWVGIIGYKYFRK